MSDSKVSPMAKRIAKTLATAFGGTPKVTRFWDDAHVSSVDILHASDRPQAGVTSYATLSLSETPLLRDGREFPVRVELLAACSSNASACPNVLATAAFCVINSGWFCAPGVIFPDVFAMYFPDSSLRHVLFVPPFLWEDELPTLELDDRTVAWLLCVPISESEYRYAEAHGSEALEDLFVEQQIDIFDPTRQPAV